MFAHYLAGEMDDGIVLSSLVPGHVTLPSSIGKGRLTITGDFPLKPSAEIRLDRVSGKPFSLSFRTPAGTRLESISVNGDSVVSKATDRGFHQVTRAWEKGDVLAVNLEYLPGSHVQTAKDGEKWVAFTYGPWALAQEIHDGSELAEPIRNLEELQAIAGSPEEQSDMPRLTIKGTEIELIPYYAAGSKTTGSRTYFEF